MHGIRPISIKKTHKLYEQMRLMDCTRILGGRMLCIDPSTGSKGPDGSMPGYAIYERGALVESGIIQLPPSGSRYGRLYELGTSLRKAFGATIWDALVVEEVPPMRFVGQGANRFGNAGAQVPLHRAVGAVESNVAAAYAIYVRPQTWHEAAPIGYVKSDEGDAILLGIAAMQYAARILQDSNEAMCAVAPKRRPRKGLGKDGYPTVYQRKQAVRTRRK